MFLGSFVVTYSKLEGELLRVEQLPVHSARLGQHAIHQGLGAAGEHLDRAVALLLGKRGLLDEQILRRDAVAPYLIGDGGRRGLQRV